MATFPVKWYNELMGGIPQLSATNGALTTLLDAVLVNGFNSKIPNYITVTGTSAEVYLGNNHGFLKDQIVLISGANESFWNSEFRVAAAGTTSIYIDVPGGTPSATGSLLIKTPPLGYEITHSTAYIRCYRSTDSTSRKFVLRVDDGNDQTTANGYNSAYAKRAKVTVFKDTTQLDLYGITGLNGTGVFNTYDQIPLETYSSNKNHTLQSGSGSATVVDGWFKWYYAAYASSSYFYETNPLTGGNRNFTIVGDSKGFFLFNTLDFIFSGSRTQYYFGEYDSLFGPNDVNNCVLSATEQYGVANSWGYAYTTTGNVNGQPGWYCPGQGNHGMAAIYGPHGVRTLRDSTGISTSSTAQIAISTSIQHPTYSSTASRSGYSTGISYPNGLSYTILIFPIFLREYNNAILKGKWPGVYYVMGDISTNSALANNEIIDSVYGYSGKKFIAVRPEVGASTGASSPGRLLLDITGPWRS